MRSIMLWLVYVALGVLVCALVGLLAAAAFHVSEAVAQAIVGSEGEGWKDLSMAICGISGVGAIIGSALFMLEEAK